MTVSDIRVLINEDSAADAELALRECRRAGLPVAHRIVDSAESFEGALIEFAPDVILSDFTVPGFHGLDALGLARVLASDTPFIFVSGTIGEESAIGALKNGATDYVLKSNLVRLPAAVERALSEAKARRERRAIEAELRETESIKRAILESSVDSIVTIDRAGSIVEFNTMAEQTFGIAREQALGVSMVDLIIPPRFRDAHRRGFENFIRTGQGSIIGKRVELAAVRADGSEFPVEITITPIHAGSRQLFAGFVHDITARKNAEARINRLTRLHAVLSGINAAIVRIRDRQELFREACRIAVEHGNFGLAWIGTLDPDTLKIVPAACAGTDADSFLALSANVAGADAALGEGLGARAVRDKRVAFSNNLVTDPVRGGERRKEAIRRGYRSGIALPLLVEGTAVGNLTLFAREADFFNDEEISLLTDLAGDISFGLEHIGKAEKLTYLAYYDELTGLPNRNLFLEHLNRVLQAMKQDGRRIVIMLADIKRLRVINDTLGRRAGDDLLRQVAARLRRFSHHPENLARISVDGFAGFLPGLQDAAEGAHWFKELLCAVVRTPFDVSGEQLTVAFTAGVSVYPDDGADAESLLKNAEAALRKAKSAGEPYLFYEPSMHARIAETLRLEGRLRRALDNEEFVLHYQPKVQARTGRLAGVEALIRWHDPRAGLVPPAQFIPLLEETGLILDVGAWVIRQALADYGAWSASGLNPPRVAVNVSPFQLRQKDFVEVVRRAAGGSSTLLGKLDLEITESLIMQDIEGNVRKLKELRDAGVGIVIDDFGPGYSSLSYLARLPVDSLKIDRSFVATMTQDSDSMTIVSTIISLAHSLKLEVIAEGVETEEQSRFLKLLNCDQLQGYLFGKAQPAADMARMLGEQKDPAGR
jgi:PAS domain S-box-containing protein/diguanylate cyclase (GGDEF)-like protein